MIPEDESREPLKVELEESREKVSKIEFLEDQCRLDEEKIRRQNEFLNRVLESLPYPFYVLDANDYTIKIANPAAHLGDLSLNSTCYGLTHRRPNPCNGLDHTCPLQQIKKTKKPLTVEHIHYNQDGNPKDVEVHAFPIFDDKGNVAQLIEYVQDITERKKMEAAIKNYAEKIKLLAYSVSHDLKNPLVGISGLTNFLCRHYLNVLDDKGKSLCDQISKSLEQVLKLIEEVNVYIRTKELPLNFEQIRPKEILDQVRSEFLITMSDHGIKWSEPDNIQEIKADKISFLRAIRNFVDNALKYGGGNLSEIKIGYEESGEFHIFSVSDNGVGIDQEHLQKVFEIFQRDDTSRGVEGTGLGLSIVKEIAGKHGGKTWAEPSPGRGVTFYLSISKRL
jgi:signal transduction histidine kinase